MELRRAVVPALAGVVAAVGVALALTAALAVTELRAARGELPVLRAALLAGDGRGAQESLARLQERAEAASAATDGPLWSVAGAVPWVGGSPSSLRTITVTVRGVADDVLPSVVELAATSGQLLPRPGQVDLDAVRAAATDLRTAHTGLRPLQAGAHQEHRGALPALARVQRDLAAELDALTSGVGTAADVGEVLPGMLGADGPRRWFLAFQNNAEARGTGGLVGAYGVLVADHGALSVPLLGDDGDLFAMPRPQVDLGAEFRQLYGDDPLRFENSNLSPHFPYAARLWLDTWARGTGQRLDGAIATDPVALSYLLAATGAVTLPAGEQVAARDVVRLTEWEAYVRHDDRQDQRKAYLVDVARAVSDRLLRGDVDAAGLISAGRRAVEGRRLLLYSAHPEEQARLEGTGVAGELPTGPAPLAAVVVNNAAGNKLDYFLGRAVDYRLGPCSGGRRGSTVAVRLDNAVPGPPLPAYASGRLDLPEGQVATQGSTKVTVALYATAGAVPVSVRVDGVPVPVRLGSERGQPVVLVPVELQPAQVRTVRIDLDEPVRAGAPRVPVQPLVAPARVTVAAAPCAPEPVEVAGVSGRP